MKRLASILIIFGMLGGAVTANALEFGNTDVLNENTQRTSSPEGGGNDGWLSIYVGTTMPTGDLSDSHDDAESFTLDVKYKASANLSQHVLLGYNKFEGKSGVSDVDWINLSVNAKYYYQRFGKGGRLFVNGGLGIYVPDTGSSKLGQNVGAGISYNLNPRLRGEVSVNFHAIITTGNSTNFYTPQVGVTYRF